VRVLFALAGAHRVRRGAEVAFESVAHQLGLAGEEVTLLGSGPALADRAYRYVGTRVVPRERFERFPRLPPVVRSEYSWEELTYVPGIVRHVRPSDFDVTVTCGYPYTNWALRAMGGRRTKHVFVTQNGDWPARCDTREFRLFGCDGLVCTNPDYFEANRHRWRCALIPNGLDPARFRPGHPERQRFGLPTDRPIVLMASALIASKRVDEAVHVVARHPDAMLVVAGDGPQRGEIDALAGALLPDRFARMVVPGDAMPALYRSADAFLHLSFEEAFGNVYIEAAASGLPVVAHRSASTRWILGDEALLVDTQNRHETVAALDTALVTAPGDLQKRAVGIHERFGWSVVAANYRDFLGEVLRAGG
jgi:glycosyltransferase involved in cell wall biosynthesis